MSATTLPSRKPKHLSSGGKYRKHWLVLICGGLVFVAAWAVWTVWLAGALPK